MNNNFTYEPGPQQWQRYLDGNMTPGEKQWFEEYLQNDEFAREAFEGFKNDPGALQYFNNQSSTVAQLPTPAANKLFLKFMVGGLIVTSAAVAGYFIMPGKEKRISNLESRISNPVESVLTEETHAVLDSEYRAIENLRPIEIKKQLVVENKTDKKITYTDISLNNQTNELSKLVVNDVEVDLKPEEELIPEPKKTVKKMPLLSFYNHKVIDYSEEYTSPIETRKIVLNGTPANQEGPDKPFNDVSDERVEHIPYNDYLKETMRFIAAKQYRTALKRFRNIHAFYPNDVNMFFYSGLCYYNLGRNAAALIAFEKCIQHEIDEFKPEAEWCKTLVLLEAGKTKEAIAMLKRIEREKGFYSQQAKEKLQSIK